MGVDFIDESEVLTVADDKNYIDKHVFKVPFVCGCKNLGEALRRINEGAAMIRTKGEAGTGDIIEAVRHARLLNQEISKATFANSEEIYSLSKELQCPSSLLKMTANLKRLPIVTFAAGGIATPADAALLMNLGMEGVFVGSGIFKSTNPRKMAEAIVQSVTNFKNPIKLAEISYGLGEAMTGTNSTMLKSNEKFSEI